MLRDLKRLMLPDLTRLALFGLVRLVLRDLKRLVLRDLKRIVLRDLARVVTPISPLPTSRDGFAATTLISTRHVPDQDGLSLAVAIASRPTTPANSAIERTCAGPARLMRLDCVDGGRPGGPNAHAAHRRFGGARFVSGVGHAGGANHTPCAFLALALRALRKAAHLTDAAKLFALTLPA